MQNECLDALNPEKLSKAAFDENEWAAIEMRKAFSVNEHREELHRRERDHRELELLRFEMDNLRRENDLLRQRLELETERRLYAEHRHRERLEEW